MSQIESDVQEISEVKSALNINDLIQLMKDECNSFEEEKRFLITQCIALIFAIIILIWAMVELFLNQISFEFATTEYNIFGMKVVYASLILAFSFQIYRIISIFYVVKLHDDILKILNAPSEDVNYIYFFPVFSIFIILLFHRFCPWIQSLPFEVFKTPTYSILLFVIGLENAMALLSVILLKKYSVKSKSPQFKLKELDISSTKKLDTFLIIGMIYPFSILLVFIWILTNLETAPVELLGIQLKFSLISIAIFFSYAYLAKPLLYRLKELVMKIEQHNELINKVVSGIITPDEIVSKRCKNIKN